MTFPIAPWGKKWEEITQKIDVHQKQKLNIDHNSLNFKLEAQHF